MRFSTPHTLNLGFPLKGSCHKVTDEVLLLGNVVVVNCGVFEIIVIRTNTYCRPLCRGTRVINVGKAVAPIERIITNACNTVADYNARKATAPREQASSIVTKSDTYLSAFFLGIVTLLLFCGA